MAELIGIRAPFRRRMGRVLSYDPTITEPRAVSDVIVVEGGERRFDPLPGFEDIGHVRDYWFVDSKLEGVKLRLPDFHVVYNADLAGDMIVLWQERKASLPGMAGDLIGGILLRRQFDFDLTFQGTDDSGRALGTFESEYASFVELRPFHDGVDDVVPAVKKPDQMVSLGEVVKFVKANSERYFDRSSDDFIEHLEREFR